MMNRRTFLQFIALLPFVPYVDIAQAPQTTSGQFVFDGVSGLTFPNSELRNAATGMAIIKFRALSFFERLLEVIK